MRVVFQELLKHDRVNCVDGRGKKGILANCITEHMQNITMVKLVNSRKEVASLLV